MAAKKKTAAPNPKATPKPVADAAAAPAKPAFGSPAWNAKYGIANGRAAGRARAKAKRGK